MTDKLDQVLGKLDLIVDDLNSVKTEMVKMNTIQQQQYREINELKVDFKEHEKELTTTIRSVDRITQSIIRIETMEKDFALNFRLLNKFKNENEPKLINQSKLNWAVIMMLFGLLGKLLYDFFSK
tara:strand:- start:1486 stop:1860 length:375 start_codon:yes stop_codon:yes gene_type:complete